MNELNKLSQKDQILPISCIYCNKHKLRNKKQLDWKKGEKLAKGYFPDLFNYYFCDGCKLTCCETKLILNDNNKTVVNQLNLSSIF